MPTTIAIFCCNYLFGEGIQLILEDIASFSVINCLHPDDMTSIQPDLIVADFTSVASLPIDELCGHGAMLVLLELSGMEKREDEFESTLITKGLVGILSPDTNASSFRKAIRTVCLGELWIGRKKLKNIISEGNIRAKENSVLTEKETAVVKMVCKGYRNKEIMQNLNVSEQAVKSHLHRIFRKVGVSDRLQLALYFMKHHSDSSA